MLVLVVAVGITGIQTAHSTHVSTPILTVGEFLDYPPGNDLTIHGWVEYNGQATSNVLLGIRVSDPYGLTISEDQITSDPDGRFEFPIRLPEDSMPGYYQADITSMCRDIHRQVCTHQAVQIIVRVLGESGEDVHIPQWIKTAAWLWTSGQINNSGFIHMIEFLIQNQIITLSDISEVRVGESGMVPDWFKTVTEYWIKGDMSDSEYVDGLRWLVKSGTIRI